MIQRTAFKALLEHKGQLLLLGLTCLVESLSIVGQAWFFGTLINNFIFSENTLQDERYTIIYLGIAIIVRLIAHYVQESVANRLGSAVKATFRKRALAHMFKLGVQHKERHGDVIHMLTDGLEQVDAYVARYIPQILYAIMIPLIMGIAIVDTLPIIGIILIVTVPLIPFFMILIGKQADRLNKEQWERMSFLSGHFLDVLQGITTLKLFGRAKDQIKVIGRLSEEFKDSTLRVLRVAFLSALVLELVSTISTALIAVYLGLTLLDGEIPFFSAFFILLLAPEFYTPFRQLGAAFHTGMAGKTSILKYEEFMNRQPSLPVGGQSKLQGPIQAIEIKDLTFTYEGSENGVQHISLVAKRNSPIMLVGESGAGKSTIAHIIGGFLTAPKGAVTIDGLDVCNIDIEWWRQQITYVSQHPHIMKGTLRDVVSFGMNVSDKEIIEACKEVQLLDVINRQQEGLDTIIGEGGLGLSGGERQRVALARAFLRKGQVLILDEVTAHLDVKTESIISSAIQRLMENKIVIIIGHRLQTMHWASTLYVLKQGRIIQQGSYEELIALDGYFKDLVTSGLGEFSSTIEEQLQTGKSFDIQDRDELDYSISIDKKDAYVRGNDTHTSEVSTSNMGLQGWRLLFTVLSPAKWSLVLALIFTFLTVFMNVGLLTVSAWLLASAALQPGLTYLSLAIVGVRFFGVSRAVCRYFERYTSHRMAFQGLYGLRVWFYAHLEPLAPAILKRFGAGDMLGRIMGDIEVLQFFYLRTLIPPVAAIALTVLVAYGVSTIDSTLVTPIVLSSLVLGLVLPLVVYAHNKQSLTEIGPQQGEYKSLLSDTMDSLEDVISYGNEDLVYHRIQHMMHIVDTNKGVIERGMNLGNTLFLGGVQITVVIVAILAANALTGAWASVMVAVAAIGTQAWFEALQPMIAAVHHGAESKVATSRLMALANEPMPVVDPKAPKPFNANRDITFTDVSFGYNQDRCIYEHLRLGIKQGQSVAIVGASGSGKTTLFNMLERLYDYGGSIHVGDVELKDISIDTWRNALGTITQDTYIFHASFEDNIRLARPDASATDLERAIDRASLRSVVDRLPVGLNTIVGSGGHGLSGGERQRVALARLFLRNPQIVLLDEPLEGLDQVTRKALHRDLMEYVKDKTCLYITHQLEGLEQMDRILFMDKGQIIEDGTYEELIALRGHFYEYCYLSMASIQ
ncbi:MAG: thiol reductant ABC exporter subunit CydD [Veillonella dispar]|uniref:Thiol reductant ABC exporter, CydD subunit n=1 Tax=Veillonella dispar ATCC 17748 TaxID=546273 RepID=C4FRF5_9FIRM|nr:MULTISPECIES: thiol reductant ABC exporter subunit CydD [Veillonella]EEP64950.1 thiol reductant ABC exporter, CydD subunit [Veillonella dispar ATCC 17748]MBS5709852.1 thiol reductant ABC exporter subunit CydD [Veillonella sp.]MDR3803113.1 thiol reductant ABC exporter subunit CydD [Veillonella sp.]MDU4886261.1 thiol reductant ABC exporter subunit CydD [Veillonella dispar]MDU5966543.1 thiol reductant ABC exporter subunit CydD [Veillonella sp.]